MSEEFITCEACGHELDEIDNPYGGLSQACLNRDCVRFGAVLCGARPKRKELEAQLADLKRDCDTWRALAKGNKTAYDVVLARAEAAEEKVAELDDMVAVYERLIRHKDGVIRRQVQMIIKGGEK